MENKIEILEFDTVSDAEAEFLKRHAEGTWVMVDRLKAVWSWKRLKHVCRFSMKKVEKRPMDITEFVDKLIAEMPKIAETFAVLNEIKRKRRIRLAMQKLENE